MCYLSPAWTRKPHAVPTGNGAGDGSLILFFISQTLLSLCFAPFLPGTAYMESGTHSQITHTLSLLSFASFSPDWSLPDLSLILNSTHEKGIRSQWEFGFGRKTSILLAIVFPEESFRLPTSPYVMRWKREHEQHSEKQTYPVLRTSCLFLCR